MDATCKSIIRYTINALLSGPDEDFNNFVKRIKGEVDSGMGPQANITFNQLVGASRKYYQNQVAQGLYGKVDPRTTQIMALTVKINRITANGAYMRHDCSLESKIPTKRQCSKTTG